ncbi:hypothetical protein PSTG_00976 [Puccinia striiformis f. sp. tritici PST-78]|uniref:ubiquitinyl hydrolase 1 n=1 Tax=Puccinia striiformis f. sp. tritici PST-78 TaxID=1165861 RepID=A0A0L0W3C6_9BASI|nr:hypothetical protein PSTG_00976 [Puccinia striiformis f. sp. tritici PST-78]
MASFSFSVEKLLSPNHDHSQPNELWPHQIWDLEYTNNWNNNVKDRLTIEELLLSKPHPTSFFCPIEWKWIIIDTLTFVPRCKQEHHFFRFFQSSTINQFNPTPKSIFDHHQSAGSSSSSWEWDSWACVNCDHAIFISSPTQAIVSVFDKQAAIDLINHAKLYNNSAAPEQAVYRAWHTVFIVIQNALLEGKLSPLPLNGKSISGRMPWDPISAKIWASLEVTRKESPTEDNNNGTPLLFLPNLNISTQNGRSLRAKWCRALLEISVFLKSFKNQFPDRVEESLKSNYIIPFNLVDGLSKISKTLGGRTMPMMITSNNNGWRTKNGLPVGWETYSKLGIVSDVTDTMVILGYQTQVKVYPHFSYLFFDAIREIHSIRESQTLADFLGIQASRGLVGFVEVKEAWDYICNDDENDQIELELDLSKEDHLINSFNSKQIRIGNDLNEQTELRNALKILVEGNPANQVLRAICETADIAAEVEEKQEQAGTTNNGKKIEMDLSKAYATLGDIVPEVDDEMIWMAYTIGVADQPGQKDVLKEALLVISKHRKSNWINQQLAAQLKDGGNLDSAMEIVAYDPPQTSFDLPAGLNNIGNTCYLNSLLQYFFSVRELREILLRFPEFEQDVDEPQHQLDFKEKKRVGGRIVSASEILRSKQFASQLQGLFREMISTRSSAVTPERELAFLALVLSKDESPINVSNGTENSNGNHNSSASTDATLVDEQPVILGPIYNPSPPSPSTNLISTASSSTVLGKRKSESSGSDDGHSSSRNPMEIDGLVATDTKESIGSPTAATTTTTKDITMATPSPILPSTSTSSEPVSQPEQSTKSISPLVIDLTDDSLPPPLPPRPNHSKTLTTIESGSHMMFGRQNDVSECMDNCLFQIQAALDHQKIRDSGEFDGDGNLVKSLFYGTTRQSLIYENPKGKVSIKEEQFAYLLVDVAEEGRDLYDGLDKVFDESEVELDNGKASRRVGLVHLPPILQIQLQRVQFDRRTHTVFKSNAHLKFGPRLRMDRYLEPDPDDQVGQEKRAKTIGLRKEIESLRGRVGELTNNLSGDKRSASTVLRDLHGILSSSTSDLNGPTPSTSTNPRKIDYFHGLLGQDELDYLEVEARAIDQEILHNKKSIKKLKAEVEQMWNKETSDDDDDLDHSKQDSKKSVDPSRSSDSIPSETLPTTATSDTPMVVDDLTQPVNLNSDGNLKDIHMKKEKGLLDEDLLHKSEPSCPTSKNLNAEYILVGLFMHRGTAQGGHYWAVQRQFPDRPDRWLKYNDSIVSEIDPSIEVFTHPSSSSDDDDDDDQEGKDTPNLAVVDHLHQGIDTGSIDIQEIAKPPFSSGVDDSKGPNLTLKASGNTTNKSDNANPYWLTYVKIDEMRKFQMLCRNP